MKKLILLFSVAFLSIQVKAQTFTDLNWNLRGLQGGAVAFADFDNDGDEDFAMSGFSSVVAEWSGIFRNDNGVPVCIDSSIVQTAFGSISWGDMDHDGDQDLIVCGQRNGTGISQLYRNDGNSVFTPIAGTNLPQINGCLRLIDYDRDSLPDIIACGMIEPTLDDTVLMMHNDGNLFFSPHNLPIPNIIGDIQVADYDGDQWPDFFITGRPSFNFTGLNQLYHNAGNGTFSLNPSVFRPIFTGTAKFGDFENDGDIDLLIDGIDSTNEAFTLVYENNGNIFTERADSLPPSGEPGAVDWADIDGDNDLDIAISGTYLMRNDGNGNYTDISPWPLMLGIPEVFADYDHDGDMDLFVMNSSGLGGTSMYRNEMINSVSNINSKVNEFIYPNPATNNISLKGNQFQNAEFKIIDVSGRILLMGSIASLQRIDVSGLEVGNYILQLSADSKIQNLNLVILR